MRVYQAVVTPKSHTQIVMTYHCWTHHELLHLAQLRKLLHQNSMESRLSQFPAVSGPMSTCRQRQGLLRWHSSDFCSPTVLLDL